MKGDLAKRIANMLFVEGGTRKHAKRLALVYKEGDSSHMCGWSKQAVIYRIRELIDTRRHKEERNVKS